MKYWIDVENGEYGLATDSADLPGLAVSGEGSVDPHQTQRMAVRAREVGGVLVMEGMETFQAVFGALESALATSFIYSPVAPTCGDVIRGPGFPANAEVKADSVCPVGDSEPIILLIAA